MTAAQKRHVVNEARESRRQKLVQTAAVAAAADDDGPRDDAVRRVLGPEGARPLWGLQDAEFPISEGSWRSFLSGLVEDGQHKQLWLESYMPGVRTLCEGLEAREKSTSSPVNVVLPEPAQPAFSKEYQKRVAKQRAKALTCMQRHPGLCRTRDRGRVASSMRFAAELYQKLHTLRPLGRVGFDLIVIGSDCAAPQFPADGMWLWPCFVLGNPRRIGFIEAEVVDPILPLVPPFTARIPLPLRIVFNFGVAAHWLRISANQGRDVVLALHRVRYRNISLSQVLVEGSSDSEVLVASTSRPSSAEPAAAAAVPALSALDLALQALAAEEAAPENQEHDDGGSSVSSGEALELFVAEEDDYHQEAEEAIEVPVSAAAVTSYFYPESRLGIISLQFARSGRAVCALCSKRIALGSLRGCYAWHGKKPSKWIHIDCVGKLPGVHRNVTVTTLREALGSGDFAGHDAALAALAALGASSTSSSSSSCHPAAGPGIGPGVGPGGSSSSSFWPGGPGH